MSIMLEKGEAVNLLFCVEMLEEDATWLTQYFNRVPKINQIIKNSLYLDLTFKKIYK